jgi:putative transposase
MKARARFVKPAWTLSVRKQCELLSVSRGQLYYTPKEERPENLQIMRIMDEHLLAHPTESVRSMVHLLNDHHFQVNPKRIRRSFGLMGYRAIYARRNLSKLGLAQYIKPYLLRGMKITRSNQVWRTDITHIPMRRGFLYLTAVMDVYSRKVLAWGISNTLEAAWCLKVVEDAIDRYGLQEIINSDHGSQYTSFAWGNFMEKQGIKKSMDGKGRATDNAWIERFWRTIKKDHLYLNPAETGTELYQQVEYFVNYYNNRHHQGIKDKPNNAYTSNSLPLNKAS